MTRKEIEDTYTVVDGIIRSPGKFEGEAVYVPYFWDAYLNGFVDEDDGNVLEFHVDHADMEQFPELKRGQVIKLYCRDDGFVCEC